MSEIASIAATIFKRAGKARRFMVAIAGPPGSGKSTLAENLHEVLPEGASAMVPMDGFHFDGQDSRPTRPALAQGCAGNVRLCRLRSASEAYPFGGAGHRDSGFRPYDRTLAGRRGNNRRRHQVHPCRGQLSPARRGAVDGSDRALRFHDLHQPSAIELERRLLERWHEHGKSDDEARAWIASTTCLT